MISQSASAKYPTFDPDPRPDFGTLKALGLDLDFDKGLSIKITWS